jgi:anti-anti-sigma regulatory factor
MLRIEVEAPTPEDVVLRVAGSVSGDAVPLLAQEIQHHFRTSNSLALNLSSVRHIDAAGLTLLAGWCQAGVVLRGGSLFIRTLLVEHGLATEDTGPS